MAQTQRLREEERKMLEKQTLNFIVEKQMKIKESDVLHTLIRKHLKDITADEVLEYRKSIMGK